MGTKCALSYANIFMGQFVEKPIFPLLTNFSYFYLNFIDDMFLIWNGTKTEFHNFLKKISKCHPSIKNLNMKYLKQKSIFFTPHCLKQVTTCKQKCMSNQPNQSCSHSKSEHHNSTKKSIAYSQVLRCNKFCCNRSDHHNNCKRLLNTLTKRGYNKTNTTTHINCAINILRNELLNKIKTSNTESLPLTVSSMFCSARGQTLQVSSKKISQIHMYTHF